MRKAVFLDRDGTIIEQVPYNRDPKSVVLLPNSIEALRLMTEKGFLLFVVSNQSGVGRGIISNAQFWSVHTRCCELLQQSQIEIKEFLYCFHHPDEQCQCRKPNPGLVKKAAIDHEVDLTLSYMAGDMECDYQLGKRMGGKGVLVLTGNGAELRASLNEADQKNLLIYDDILGLARSL